MKNFYELTDNEILNLTDEQLKKYWQLEMANEGVPFLDKPKEPDYENIDLPDLILYSIPLLGLYSTHREIMEKIKIIIDNSRETLRIIDYDYFKDKFEYEVKTLKINKYDDKEVNFLIKENQVYSEHKMINLRDVNNRNKKKYEKHCELVEKFKENEELRNECKARIYDEYNLICEKNHEIKRHKERFKEYLILAGKNKKTALAFYKKAYNINKEIEEILLN